MLKTIITLILFTGTVIAGSLTVFVTFQTKGNAKTAHKAIRHEIDYKFDFIQKSLNRIEERLNIRRK